MSKNIFLLRHAEAASGYSDFERPLTSRGLETAKQVGAILYDYLEFLNDSQWMISSARRTKETFDSILRGLAEKEKSSISLNHKFKRELYEAGPEDVFRHLSDLSPTLNTVVILGHNPTISQVASIISKSNMGFSPGQGVGLSCKIGSWQEVDYCESAEIIVEF